MTDETPRISVIIAAYAPGAGIDRVIASLDAQTLPQHQFETIVVDDGSPDDTFARLQAFASSRPNMRVHRIENSGWPSRPRNVATDMARGEWVMFMDHDDSLYPDALRRAAEYAAETGADLLSPKESKTTDVWWGMSSLEQGNLPDVHAAGGIHLLAPMVPHKLYRRAFLAEHGIRFPEGRRMLWEDIYLNVAAYARAQHVAVLADTPFYLWQSSPTNNSKTYGPTTAEYWDRLDDLLAFIDTTLAGPDLAEPHRDALLQQYRDRVLSRFSGILPTATPDEIALALVRARRIQDRYYPPEWDPLLRPAELARALLLRSEQVPLLTQLQVADKAVKNRARTTAIDWREGRLHLDVEARWLNQQDAPVRFLPRGGRILRDLPDAVLAALPPEAIDVTDSLDSFMLQLAVRSRAERVTWQFATDSTARFEALPDDAVTVVGTTHAELDPATAVAGRPLDAPIWDFYAASRWIGLSRGSGVRSRQPARAALLHGRPMVAYANATGNLSLDTEQRLRNIVKDGRPDLAGVTGDATRFRLPLPGVHVHGPGETRAEVVLTSTHAEQPAPLASPVATLPGRIAADTGADGDAGHAAWLEAGGAVRSGTYRVWVRVASGVPLIAPFVLHVAHHGGPVDLVARALPVRIETAAERRAERVVALRARARGVARRTRDRLFPRR